MKKSLIFITSLVIVCILINLVIFKIMEKNTKKEVIIFVQSDLFKTSTPIKLDNLFNNEIKEFSTNTNEIDYDFKQSLFYSDLSIAVLNKSKTDKNFDKYVNLLYLKSIEKWDDLIKKDSSMIFFKDFFIKTYKNKYYSKTN